MLVTTKEQWLRVVEEISRSPIHSYDTEYRGRYPDQTVVGFSLAWGSRSEVKGCYVPLKHVDENDVLLPGQLPYEDVQDELADILGSEKLTVMHNGKVDIKAATRFPKPIQVGENIADTIIMSWLLNTNGVGNKKELEADHGSHGLKDLSFHILGYKMSEFKEVAPRIDKEYRVDRIPLDVAGKYGFDDAVQTLKLYFYFLEKLEKQPKLLKIFNSVYREYVHILAEMEMWGVPLDKELLGSFKAKIDPEVKETLLQMYLSRKGQDFGPIESIGKLKDLVAGWDDLEMRFTYDKSDHRYPSTLVLKGKKGHKYEVRKPAGKGGKRKQLIVDLGFEGHPVVAKIKDDWFRSEVRRLPHLAHKIFKPGSAQDINKVLFDEGELKPLAKLGKNGYFPARAEHVKVWAKHDTLAKYLLRLRKIEKLDGTYLVGMVQLLSEDERIRTNLSPTGARTGRLSSSDPNLQNIPILNEFPIRRAFCSTGVIGNKYEIHSWHHDKDGKETKPNHISVESSTGGWEVEEGKLANWHGSNPPWVLGVSDYSQLELRLLAHASLDEVLIDAILHDIDIHSLSARAFFDEIPNDFPLEEVEKSFAKQRKDAKPVNFGVLYGMGPHKLARTLGITVEQATEIINVRYMGLYKGVAKWIERQHEQARLYGFVTTAIGRPRHLPNAMLQYTSKRNRVLIGGAMRQAQNSPIQGFAADIAGIAMRNIRRHFKGTNEWGESMRLLLQVHDELVEEFHPAVANMHLKKSVEIMEGVFKLAVPLKVSAALGANWFDTKA